MLFSEPLTFGPLHEPQLIYEKVQPNTQNKGKHGRVNTDTNGEKKSYQINTKIITKYVFFLS